MGQAKFRDSQQQRIEQAKQRLANEAKVAKDSVFIKNNAAEIKNNMAHTTVEKFAAELKLPTALLLEQLGNAGIHKASASDQLVENDKSVLLEHLRKEHGTLVVVR